jgi:hypothetical protein
VNWINGFEVQGPYIGIEWINWLAICVFRTTIRHYLISNLHVAQSVHKLEFLIKQQTLSRRKTYDTKVPYLLENLGTVNDDRMPSSKRMRNDAVLALDRIHRGEVCVCLRVVGICESNACLAMPTILGGLGTIRFSEHLGYAFESRETVKNG